MMDRRIATFDINNSQKEDDVKGLLVPLNRYDELKMNAEVFNIRCTECGAKKAILNINYCPYCNEKTPNTIEVVKSKNIDTMATER